MTIIVVQPEPLKFLPPTITLLTILSEKHKVFFISKSNNDEYQQFFKENNIRYFGFEDKLRLRHGLFPAIIERYINNKKVWKTIQRYGDKDSIIWTTTDHAAVLLNIKLKNCKHVMQLMELIQVEKLKGILPFSFKHSLKNIAKHAKVMVVPEYNRAHITKAWWNLQNLPLILPNKPIYHPQKKNLQISDRIASELIQNVIAKGKKIILYQGALNQERRIAPFIDAVETLSSRYTFVVMGIKTKYLDDLLRRNTNIVHIPWVKAPYHLEITSWASIGILVYEPTQLSYFSVLNALYCAPNKIYEYSGFGIPMIANDCPALATDFALNNTGRIVNIDKEEDIIKEIEFIENNYEEMSQSCLVYFNHVDLRNIVENIIRETNCRSKIIAINNSTI